MITEEQIKIISIKYQTTELNVRREYFQHLFLSYFYQLPETEEIYFKGGTALRVIYGSPRFSEDLDFSAKEAKTKDIEKVILQTIDATNKENIDTSLIEAKETSGGYLAHIGFKTAETTVSVLVQISLREKESSGEVVTISNDFIPPYVIVRLSEELLVGEKLKALLSRQKPRDFYDLYFILRSGLLPKKKNGTLTKALEVLNKTDINFEKELKEYLPQSHWAIIRNFKETLKREIEKYI